MNIHEEKDKIVDDAVAKLFVYHNGKVDKEYLKSTISIAMADYGLILIDMVKETFKSPSLTDNP